MCFKDSLDKLCTAVADDARLAPPPPVSDAELADAAARMTRAGYDFRCTPNSLDALRHYLEGRSLMLAGTVGTGKTYFFKALWNAGVARQCIHVYPLSIHGNEYCSAIVEEMRARADDEVIVDDVGCESTWDGRRADDVLARVIAVREASPRRTHFTTNLTSEALKVRYDERVVSRLRRCVFVPMVGPDNRRAYANREEDAFRRACADPANWALCAERCPHFSAKKCGRGVAVPPILQSPRETPESACGVGTLIPYRPGYLEAEAVWRARRGR